MIGYLILILLCAAADRGLKVMMSALLADGGAVMVIPGVFRLRYLENTGAAFGMFQNGTLLLTIFTSALILILLYIIVSKKFSGRAVNFALALITAGGIGNLYDRIVNGFVVDYFEFAFVNYAVFNFADTLINIGAVILAVAFIVSERKAAVEKKKAAGALAEAGEPESADE